jgi:hypothetical protein
MGAATDSLLTELEAEANEVEVLQETSRLQEQMIVEYDRQMHEAAAVAVARARKERDEVEARLLETIRVIREETRVERDGLLERLQHANSKLQQLESEQNEKLAQQAEARKDVRGVQFSMDSSQDRDDSPGSPPRGNALKQRNRSQTLWDFRRSAEALSCPSAGYVAQHCVSCERDGAKHKEMQKKWFLEAEHLRDAIGKLVCQLGEYMHGPAFNHFKQSLNLEVRYLSAHKENEEEDAKAKFKPAVQGPDAYLQKQIKKLKQDTEMLNEEVADLKLVIEKLEQEVASSQEKAEAAEDRALKEAAAARRLRSELEATSGGGLEVGCQTDLPPPSPRVATSQAQSSTVDALHEPHGDHGKKCTSGDVLEGTSTKGAKGRRRQVGIDSAATEHSEESDHGGDHAANGGERNRRKDKALEKENCTLRKKLEEAIAKLTELEQANACSQNVAQHDAKKSKAGPFAPDADAPQHQQNQQVPSSTRGRRPRPHPQATTDSPVGRSLRSSSGPVGGVDIVDATNDTDDTDPQENIVTHNASAGVRQATSSALRESPKPYGAVEKQTADKCVGGGPEEDHDCYSRRLPELDGLNKMGRCYSTHLRSIPKLRPEYKSLTNFRSKMPPQRHLDNDECRGPNFEPYLRQIASKKPGALLQTSTLPNLRLALKPLPCP